MKILRWLTLNYDLAIAVLSAVTGVFFIVAKATPWGWDDKLAKAMSGCVKAIKRGVAPLKRQKGGQK